MELKMNNVRHTSKTRSSTASNLIPILNSSRGDSCVECCFDHREQGRIDAILFFPIVKYRLVCGVVLLDGKRLLTEQSKINVILIRFHDVRKIKSSTVWNEEKGGMVSGLTWRLAESHYTRMHNQFTQMLINTTQIYVAWESALQLCLSNFHVQIACFTSLCKSHCDLSLGTITWDVLNINHLYYSTSTMMRRIEQYYEMQWTRLHVMHGMESVRWRRMQCTPRRRAYGLASTNWELECAKCITEMSPAAYTLS